MSGTGATGARRRIDLLAPVCGVVALGVYLLHGFEGVLLRDPAVYAYAGQRVADGLLPYEGILNRAGPLAHAVPGVGARVGRLLGADELVAMRALMMVLSVAAVMVLYRTGRDLFASRPAGLATAAALLCFQGFLRAATYGPREKTAMVLFLALALLAVTHQRWATAGALVALGTLTWQPLALSALPAVGVAALLGAGSGWRGRLRALLRIVAGGMVPTVLTLAVYGAGRELPLLVDDFFLVNLRYTGQSSVLAHPLPSWADLQRGYGWTVWVLCGGLLSVLVHAGVALTRRTRTRPRNATLAGLGVFVVVNVLWAGVSFNGWPDAFVVLPAAALGIGGIVAALGRGLPVRAVVAVAVAWALVATGSSAAYAHRSSTDRVPVQRAEAEALMRALPPGARLLTVESPVPLVLLGRRNPSRLQLFGNGLQRYVDDTRPGGSAGYALWIERRRIEVLMVAQLHKRPWLQPMLARSYVRVGGPHAIFPWYLRRDLAESAGEEELEDAMSAGREAAHAARS